MTTNENAVNERELQPASAAELTAEAGAEEMVAGMETLDVARGLARDAAAGLAAGASDLTRAEDALLVAERVADLSSVVAAAGVVDMAQGAELLRGFSHVGERYLPEALHALRRSVRRLRYAAEVEDVVRGEESRAPVLWKRLQDGIGVIHDHDVLACWFDEQARLAAGRDNALLVRAARRERRAVIGLARLLHRALLETRPADLALRALQAMARGRTITSA